MNALLICLFAIPFLAACGGPGKYKVDFANSGFSSEKTSYRAGTEVTVTYGAVATDTDYRFYTEPEELALSTDFDGDHSYNIQFTMPAHDVTFHVDKRNLMEVMDPSEITFPDSTEAYEDQMTGDHMVFDYYEAVTATVGGDGHDEFVLYDPDGTDALLLASYSKWNEEPETMTCCFVPPSVLNDCMDLVQAYDCANWKNGSGITGKLYVVKFPNGEKFTRVSSENMPENGEEAFSRIKSVLQSAWNEYGPADVE